MRASVCVPDKRVTNPDKKRYLWRAGFSGSAVSVSGALRKAVNEIYLEGVEIATPVIAWRSGRIASIPGGFMNEVIAPGWQKWRGATVWVATLGETLDRKIDAYMTGGDVLRASLLDSWGSEAVEKLNDWWDNELRARFGNGCRRFSPGYGPVSPLENLTALGWLNPGGREVAFPVRANVMSGALLPRKSTVAIIAWK